MTMPEIGTDAANRVGETAVIFMLMQPPLLQPAT